MASPLDTKVLLQRTRDAAAAFVEDMHHIREIIVEKAPGPTRAEMRRLSAVLRRLIVEDDLQKIGNPRLGRIKLLAPDTKSLIALKPHAHLIIGNNGSALTMWPHPPVDTTYLDQIGKRRILVNADSFRTQPVLSFNGVWVRRLDVIKFVANSLSGVHSKDDRESAEGKVMAMARTALVRTVNEDGSTNVMLKKRLFGDHPEEPQYDSGSLDPLLLELLFTSELLSKSEDVIRLEDVVRSEINYRDR